MKRKLEFNRDQVARNQMKFINKSCAFTVSLILSKNIKTCAKIIAHVYELVFEPNNFYLT